MSDKLKQKVLEFVAIAKECPENLQEKCFELLLSNYLAVIDKPSKADAERIEKDANNQSTKINKEERETNQEDILETDLHIKVKQFLKKVGLTVKNLNELFYKEQGKFLPLYDDIKTTKTAESQIRIALLQALSKSMVNGDFEFNGEAVRSEAVMRKCYDSANFAKNFNNSKDLFEGFEKYDKASPIIRLNSEGKDRLAEIIKDLQ